jgi:hypothetical protein
LRKAQRAAAIKRHQKAKKRKRIVTGAVATAGVLSGVGAGYVMGKKYGAGGKKGGGVTTHAPAPSSKQLSTPMPGATAPNLETARQMQERIMSEAKISGGPHQMPPGWNRKRKTKRRKRGETAPPPKVNGRIPGMVYRITVDKSKPSEDQLNAIRNEADPRTPKGRRRQHRTSPPDTPTPEFHLNNPDYGIPESLVKGEKMTNREIARAVSRSARARGRSGAGMTREERKREMNRIRQSHGTPRVPRTGQVKRAKKKKK